MYNAHAYMWTYTAGNMNKINLLAIDKNNSLHELHTLIQLSMTEAVQYLQTGDSQIINKVNKTLIVKSNPTVIMYSWTNRNCIWCHHCHTFRIFLCVCRHAARQMMDANMEIIQWHYSTGLFQGFSFNFKQRRGLVRMFHIPIHERNVNCRSIARVESSLC